MQHLVDRLVAPLQGDLPKQEKVDHADRRRQDHHADLQALLEDRQEVLPVVLEDLLLLDLLVAPQDHLVDHQEECHHEGRPEDPHQVVGLPPEVPPSQPPEVGHQLAHHHGEDQDHHQEDPLEDHQEQWDHPGDHEDHLEAHHEAHLVPHRVDPQEDHQEDRLEALHEDLLEDRLVDHLEDHQEDPPEDRQEDHQEDRQAHQDLRWEGRLEDRQEAHLEAHLEVPPVAPARLLEDRQEALEDHEGRHQLVHRLQEEHCHHRVVRLEDRWLLGLLLPHPWHQNLADWL